SALAARACAPCREEGGGRDAAATQVSHAIWMLWFFSGNERMRWPVALKNALSTAGAAPQLVGSPTPPQGSLPPDGLRIDSPLGFSAMRIELYLSKLVCSMRPSLTVHS